MKTFNKESDTNLVKRSVDVVAQNIPGFSLAWGLGKALLGNAIELRQQRALEFVEMVRDEPSLFNQKLLESHEFQDAFIFALEEYMRARTILKKEVCKKIFRGFASDEDKQKFELERHYSTLKNISVNALGFMSFVANELEPKRQQRIEDQVKKIDFDKSELDEAAVRSSIDRQQRLSYVYNDWKNRRPLHTQVMVPDKPNPDYPTTSSSTGVYVLNKDIMDKEEALIELAVLGIVQRDRYSQTDPGWSQTPHFIDSWTYTEYGKKFTKFVD